MPLRLHAFDLGVVGLYLVAITVFGLRFSRKGTAKDKSLRGYFLADKTVPWWAIALSIVSAETSTLTIISIPGVAFAGDFGFLQVVIGYMLGRVVVALLFLPRYFRGEMMTAYQLIDRRFGPALHKVTAGLFLVMRAAAEGVRVFAISIVVAIAIGTGNVLSIAIISALTLVYTFEGGMAAVIWTDVVQMGLYGVGTVVALVTLGAHVGGAGHGEVAGWVHGWAYIWSVAAPLGKFHMLNFALNLTTTYTFWAGVLGGTFLTMASHGTDQLMVQRMLAAKNLRESQVALLSSGVVIFVQFALFLLIGVGLFVFYGMHPRTFASADRIFPTYIVSEMPVGAAGLLVAAILAAAMSNLSAALNSLSSATVVDFYMGWRPEAKEGERMLVSRSSTVLWALVLFAVAVYSVHAGGKGHVVEIGLSIASVAYGSLLGVFLLGTLTRYATQGGAIVGMVVGFCLNMALWLQPAAVRIAGVTVPKVAWTWYVLIGAAATFGVGMAASLVMRPRMRKAAVAAVVLLGLGICGAKAWGQRGATERGRSRSFATLRMTISQSQPRFQGGEVSQSQGGGVTEAKGPDFAPVSALIEQAIAQDKLPGAVLLVGHDGRRVFEQAYGVRKLAGEPGLDGRPAAAEPMTEDTVFDMASLSKCLVTATAVMQLVEEGKVDVDAPVARYLPAFGVNGKAKVTVRELLTHYSGLPPDVDLTDDWGLARPDEAEGVRRAMESKLVSTPGTHFEYSDVNFITLGALVQKLSGEPLDVYAERHIFGPLGMTHTSYHPFAKACGRIEVVGAAVYPGVDGEGRVVRRCGPGMWSPDEADALVAPTRHDDQGTVETNPNYDRLLRGTVDDPTTRRMGGVAGHAGVFSTAGDVAKFAQALLDRLAGRPSDFPLKRSALELMTRPEQPKTAEGGATIFTPDGKVTTGIAQRGFGWDINSAFSRPRGAVFPTYDPAHYSGLASFGHTGFTGTSLWMDPGSDTYVVLLANSVHPRGRPAISPLRGQVATAVAKALEIDGESSANGERALTGIDVLEATDFAALREMAKAHGGRLRVGLLTNQTGVDAEGRRTIDVLRGTGGGIELMRLFSPEHGIFGRKDSTEIGQEVDAATGLKVTSLYGAKDSDRRPMPEELKDLDAVVIDLQDAGVRFYTYETVVGYFVEASACEAARGHALEIVVLDRPDPIGGVKVEGPVSDMAESYIDYMAEPVRNGMTLGELAEYMRGEHPGACGAGARVKVVEMRGWRRDEYFDRTGIKWVNPSPNLRNVQEEELYPGVGMMDATNVSVGRGTAMPFEVFGAAWMDGAKIAEYLAGRRIPGVTFQATRFAVEESANHYPYHGQTIEGVRMTVTDREALDSPELGIEILSALHHLYPAEFKLEKAAVLVANRETMAALERGDDPRAIAAGWKAGLERFEQRRVKYLIYR